MAEFGHGHWVTGSLAVVKDISWTVTAPKYRTYRSDQPLDVHVGSSQWLKFKWSQAFLQCVPSDHAAEVNPSLSYDFSVYKSDTPL